MKRHLFIISILLATIVPADPLFAVPPQGSTPQDQVKVKVTDQGFQPATMTVRTNVPAKITFVRQTDKTCATEVVIPDYNIKRELPLNKPVVVEFTPKKTGEIAFMCGMNMFRGKVVVQDK